MRPVGAKVAVVLLLALAIGMLAEPASACSTCFGAEDSSLTKGMNSAILTLLGIIGAVQVGFVTMFTGFIVRSRRLRDRQDRSRLFRGGSS
jgi:hypothetical protein